MNILTLAAAAAVLTPAAVALQEGSVAEQAVLPGATPAADCGNLYGLAGQAFCVSAPLAGIGALADAYVADLEAKGWIPADGNENRVVFIRRREGGGCEGLQMQVFQDSSRPAGPDAVGYLGFGRIPGDVCAQQSPTRP